MARKKSYDRNAVLDQSMRLFWRQGYRATSLSDLTEQTGLNRKSLYAEFGSKEMLYRAALTLYADARNDIAQHCLTREPLGLQNIQDFFRALCGTAERRGCLFTLSLNEREIIDDASIVFVEDVMTRLESLFLVNLTAESATKSKSECRKLAKYLIVFMHGLMTAARSHSRRQLDQLVDIGLNACLATR